MDPVSGILTNLWNALTITNIWYALLGTGIGMLVGVLPGLGPAAAAAVLLPVTFSLDPTGGIIMLAAVYYGSMFGGTITSVLLNVPGEASSAITCIEGHPMAKSGRAGVAITIAAVASFSGGIVSTAGLIFAAPFLSSAALRFGPPEQFMLLVFAMTMLLVLAGSSLLKATLMGLLGLFLGTVGLDPTMGLPRFTGSVPELFDGISFVPVVMGVFGFTSILIACEQRVVQERVGKVGRLLPSWAEFKRSGLAIVRGSGIGFFLGLIPGMMPSVSAFIAFSSEKTFGTDRTEFGKGAVSGVAGPEAANNGHGTAAIIPLLALGIPTTPTVAIIMGGFLVHGITPGPLLIRDHPDVVWGVVASFIVGNMLLMFWSIPLISIWVSVLRVPSGLLYALVIILMMIGSYAIYSSVIGIYILIVSGVVGYFLHKNDFPIIPLILTLVIGPMMERNLIQTLEMTRGNLSEVFSRPISVTFFLMAVLVIVSWLIQYIRRIRQAET
ncbi:tripartite tricarboxylate transporter permease [Pelagibius sp.]|uniref:tripartite tricarboxylate transporter permease n=1 Tax=Pelagibius sp. TaxID=1931238 RepID=UPI003BAED4B7